MILFVWFVAFLIAAEGVPMRHRLRGAEYKCVFPEYLFKKLKTRTSLHYKYCYCFCLTHKIFIKYEYSVGLMLKGVWILLKFWTRCWRTVIANLLFRNALTGLYKNKFTRPTKSFKITERVWKCFTAQVDKTRHELAVMCWVLKMPAEGRQWNK